MYITCVYNMQKTIKTLFCVHRGLDIFCCQLFFQIRPCLAANPLLAGAPLETVFGCIWGSVWHLLAVFFSAWCWKNTSISWVHPNLVGNTKVCVALWPDLGPPSRPPICSRSGWNWRLLEDLWARVVNGIKQAFTIKHQNTNWRKKKTSYG